ncbi:MAG: sel1 repeat family protein [Lachnospiraceae bacterium]|nr:sel1 repeat family protein [Lachnospiraceae bacterium]
MPKYLPKDIESYYKQPDRQRFNLNEFFYHLLGDSKTPSRILKINIQKRDRLEKLSLLLPISFIQILEQKNPGYLSHYMLCNSEAHTIHKTFHEQVQHDFTRILNIIADKARDLLYEDQHTIFDNDALKKFLLDDFCRSQSTLYQVGQVNLYQRRLQFCYDMDPAAALARVVLYLSLGPYCNRNLDQLFPSGTSLLQTEHVELQTNDIWARKSYADYLYDEGKRAEAFKVYEILSNQLQDGSVYCRLATMCETGSGTEKDYAKAFTYYTKSAATQYADGYYGLYRCLLHGIGRSSDTKKARINLEKAYDKGSRIAARDMGIAHYTGHTQMDFEMDPILAQRYFQAGIDQEQMDEVTLTCLYMLGLCHEKYGKDPSSMITAKDYYTKAAKYGHFSSQERLLDMEWTGEKHDISKLAPQSDSKASISAFCYFNCDPEDTFYQPNILASEQFDLFYGKLNDILSEIFSPEQIKARIDAQIESPALFYLFHPSEEKNRNDTAELLEYFKKICDVYPKWTSYLSSTIKFYVRSTQPLTITMLDSMISSMRNKYFQVRICNPYKDAAEWLYANRPLFLPNIKDQRKQHLNVTIIGNGNCVPWLIRDAISVCHIGIPFTLSVISSDIVSVKQTLKKECSGIFRYPRLMKTKLNFISFDTDDPELYDMLDRNYESENAQKELIAAVLQKTDYFILASDQSSHNLEQAMQIREWCIKTDPSFSRFPTLAAYCPDSRLSWQSQKFTVGNAPIGYEWYNNYDIHCFGAFADLYSNYYLNESLLEKRALQTHLSYYGDISDDSKCYRALFSYYSRHYNRDSSRCSALYLIYRAFSMGIFLHHGSYYGIAENERTLAKLYETSLKTSEHSSNTILLHAARLEHERWCGFMLTRGWTPATIDQMELYMQRGNPGHQFYLAKMHPYLCTWDDLGNEHSGVEYHLNQTLKLLNPDAKPKKLKEMNVDNVRNSIELFRL